MKTHFKSLKTNTRTSTITMEHDDATKSHIPEHELRAIAILLGGYNKYGRAIPLEEWEPLKQKFEDLLFEVKTFLYA